MLQRVHVGLVAGEARHMGRGPEAGERLPLKRYLSHCAVLKLCCLTVCVRWGICVHTVSGFVIWTR